MKLTRWFLLFTGLLAATVLRAEDTWGTDFAAAKLQAAHSGKKLLLDFTGSDWCGYCIKLDHEVLGTAEFAAFAKGYVLVRLDFPRKKALSATEKAQNEALRQQFQIEGYPTLIITNAAGKELSRAVGYEPGSGPKAYLAELTGK